MKVLKRIGKIIAAPFVFIRDTVTFARIIWDESKDEEAYDGQDEV